METWLPLPGYEDLYEVSDLGHVRNSKNFHLLALRTSTNNQRPSVSLWRKGSGKSQHVHVLVLRAFRGPRPIGMQGCHNDGNCKNNELSKLRWDTPTNNAADKFRHGTMLIGEKCPAAKLTEQDVKSIRIDTRGQKEIAAQYGVCQPQISKIKSGSRWAHSS